MNKTILTILVFCFAVFSVSAQVENKTTTTDSQKNAVEQSKIQKEKTNNVRATEANQGSLQPENVNAPLTNWFMIMVPLPMVLMATVNLLLPIQGENL